MTPELNHINSPATSNRPSARSSRASSPIDGGIRKRVGKACDRCRMKKSRCDGALPCGKCKADNSICVYGRRKRSAQDKVYPRGYVELLEHQQAQLVLGLQELYRRSIHHNEGQDNGLVLPEISNDTVPTTHDLLSWLGALDQDKHDTSDNFYEDFYTMQAVAMLDEPSSVKRGTSFDSIATRSELDQTPDMEPANIRELDYAHSYPSYVTQASLVDSPQPLPVNLRSPPAALTTTEPAPTFTQISWQTEPTEIQATDLNIFESWTYDTDIQAMYTAQMGTYQQPTEMSINPYLTLKDWSLLDAYRSDNSFLYA